MFEVDVKALRKAMIDQGYNTLNDLSSVSGINRNTLSQVLRKRSYPSIAVIHKLIRVLHLTGEEAGRIFLEWKPDEEEFS